MTPSGDFARRAGLGIVLTVSVVACSSTSTPANNQAPSSPRTSANGAPAFDVTAQCAAAYRIAPPDTESTQTVSKTGCGQLVLLSAADLDLLLPPAGWEADTGTINSARPIVSIMSATACQTKPQGSAVIVGAQVADYIRQEQAYWQDVLVLRSAHDTEAVRRGRVKQALCPSSVPPFEGTKSDDVGGDIGPDLNHGVHLIPGSTRLASGDGWDVVLPPAIFSGSAVVVAASGNYYTESFLPLDCVADGVLTPAGRGLIDKIMQRLGGE